MPTSTPLVPEAPGRHVWRDDGLRQHAVRFLIRILVLAVAGLDRVLGQGSGTGLWSGSGSGSLLKFGGWVRVRVRIRVRARLRFQSIVRTIPKHVQVMVLMRVSGVLPAPLGHIVAAPCHQGLFVILKHVRIASLPLSHAC